MGLRYLPYYIFSPFYLFPALIGYIFYVATEYKKVIDIETYKGLKKWRGEKWHEANMGLMPFWKKKSDPLLFLIPGYNVILLIAIFIMYWRDCKITNEYLSKHVENL